MRLSDNAVSRCQFFFFSKPWCMHVHFFISQELVCGLTLLRFLPAQLMLSMMEPVSIALTITETFVARMRQMNKWSSIHTNKLNLVTPIMTVIVKLTLMTTASTLFRVAVTYTEGLLFSGCGGVIPLVAHAKIHSACQMMGSS